MGWRYSIVWHVMNRFSTSGQPYDASLWNGSINVPMRKRSAETPSLAGVSENADFVLHLALSTLSGEMPTYATRRGRAACLIRHRPVALLLAADRIKNLASATTKQSVFSRRFPHDLIQEAAAGDGRATLAQQHLSDWLNLRERDTVHPMAASLMHAAVPGWRPGPDCRPRLTGAYLARAAWPGLNLSRVNLESVDFKGGQPEPGELEKITGHKARFSRTNLQGDVA